MKGGVVIYSQVEMGFVGPGILGRNKYLISFSISRFLRKKSFFLGSQRFRSVKTNQRRVAACAYRGFSFSFLWGRLSRFVFVSLSRGFCSDSSQSDSFSREIWEGARFLFLGN